VPLVESAATVLLATVDSTRKCQYYNKTINVIILDEGGYVPEYKMPLLTRFNPDLLLVVGDHHQLPPYTDCVDFNPVSVLERMAEAREATSQPLKMLEMQYRMHPAICRVVSKNFYEGKLKTAPTATARLQAASRAPVRPIRWYTHSSGEQPSGTSWTNPEECRILCDEVLPSLEQEVMAGNRILVITPYKAQMLLIKETLEERGLLRESLSVMTVDACQGSEADISIVSTVRSNPYGNIGFMGTDWRRANVALSRAKNRLIIVGDHKCMTRRQRAVWQELWRMAVKAPSLGSEGAGRAL